MSRFPDIPLFHIYQDLKTFVPRPDDQHSGIDYSLSTQGREMFAGGNHRIIEMKATSPHYPQSDHQVWWVDRRSYVPQVSPWNYESETAVLKDGDFLAALEHKIAVQHNQQPDAHFYMHLGFVPAGYTPPTDQVIPNGLKSQDRMHLHRLSYIPQPPDKILDPEDEKDKGRLALFFNIAGENAIRLHQQHLASYGTEFSFFQTVGETRTLEYPRTMFGFPSLQEALVSSVHLQREVAGEWIDRVAPLALSCPEIAGVFLEQMQSCIPNVIVIIPSEKDRAYGNVDNTFPVWTMPFAVCTGRDVLVGATVQRMKVGVVKGATLYPEEK